MKDKKSRKSKQTVVDKESGIMSGIRTLVELQPNTLYVNVPREFVEQHGLKKGSKMTFGANHLLKYMPVEEK